VGEERDESTFHQLERCLHWRPPEKLSVSATFSKAAGPDRMLREPPASAPGFHSAMAEQTVQPRAL
jgi:hypothetical protein